MDFGLEDKVALVVDSHLAIPNAAAAALADEGAILSLTAPDNYHMRHVEIELARRHIAQERFRAVIADLERERDIRRLVRETVHRQNAIAILVTSVQEREPAPASVLQDEQIEPALARNFMTMVHLTREVLPHMKRLGSGRIINLIPSTAMASSPRTALSSLSMAPALAYFKSLAFELAPQHITVNNVIYAGVPCGDTQAPPPDAAAAPHAADLAGATANAAGAGAGADGEPPPELLPMRRMGQPKEVGDIVCMIASAQASYLTGANIVVDGGSHHSYV